MTMAIPDWRYAIKDLKGQHDGAASPTRCRLSLDVSEAFSTTSMVHVQPHRPESGQVRLPRRFTMAHADGKHEKRGGVS